MILNSVFGLCRYTSDTGQAEVAISNMVRGLYPNHRNDERHTAWTFCPCRQTPGTCYTTKIGSPTLVLITHFAAEIMLIAFLNQGCERPSSGFKCHLTADVAEFIRWIYALSWHINGGTNTVYFSDDNTWQLVFSPCSITCSNTTCFLSYLQLCYNVYQYLQLLLYTTLDWIL